jgi:hypothetical protein
MIRTVASILILFILTGCGDGEKVKNVPYTYEIDGCEYLGCPNGHLQRIYTHKGNCKNPIHIYKEVNNAKEDK